MIRHIRIVFSILILIAGHDVFAKTSPGLPILEQVVELWRHFQDNRPSGRQLKRMSQDDCKFWLASTFYDHNPEIDEALGYMSGDRFEIFISDIVGDETSQGLLQDAFSSINFPDSDSDEVTKARFTLAAFLHLARTAGKQDQPRIRELIHFVIAGRNPMTKKIVNMLIFSLGERAEAFAQEANLLPANLTDKSENLARQQNLRSARESLSLVLEAMEAAGCEDSNFLYTTALKAHRDFAFRSKLRNLLREYRADTRLRSQKEYLERKEREFTEALKNI